jgi:hypothetical protein
MRIEKYRKTEMIVMGERAPFIKNGSISRAL